VAPNQQFPQAQRYPPTGTGWYRNDGRPLPYPPPLMSLEMDMERLELGSTNNGFYNGAPTANNYGQGNFPPVSGKRSRNASSSLSNEERANMSNQQKRRSAQPDAHYNMGYSGAADPMSSPSELSRLNSGESLSNVRPYYWIR
jgi:hypothetical protein